MTRLVSRCVVGLPVVVWVHGFDVITGAMHSQSTCRPFLVVLADALLVDLASVYDFVRLLALIEAVDVKSCLCSVCLTKTSVS